MSKTEPFVNEDPISIVHRALALLQRYTDHRGSSAEPEHLELKSEMLRAICLLEHRIAELDALNCSLAPGYAPNEELQIQPNWTKS